jgi:hypothetical protein
MMPASTPRKNPAPLLGTGLALSALLFLPSGAASAAPKPSANVQSTASSSTIIERIVDRWTPVSSDLKQDVALWRAQFRAVLEKSSAQTLQTIDAMPARAAGPNHTLTQAYGYAYRLAAADAGATMAKSAAGQSMLKLGSATSDLVFVPITPCRVVDTRNAGGPIGANTQRNFYYYSDGGNGFGAQGGDPGPLGTTCPSTVFGGTPPAAAAATVTAVNTTAAGNFVVWGGGPSNSIPNTSALNWGQAGAVIANTTVVPGGLRVNGNLDFAVRYNGPTGSSDVVVDIVGYYVENVATALDCTTTLASGPLPISNFTTDFTINYPACPTGYSQTGGFCNGGGNTGATGIYLIESGPTGCTWRNTSGATQTGNAVSQCCRVPGR